MPKLSFIVPVYNTAPYLSTCLDSLLSQTRKDFEIIAVDDGSTDQSLSILQSYQEQNPHCLHVFHQENGGLSEARNRAMAEARGEYLAFVDSDDFIPPDFAQILLEKAEGEDLDLVLFDFDYYYSDRPPVPAALSKNLSPDPHRDALLSSPMACTRLVRRRLFEGLSFPKGLLYEDLSLTPKLLLQAKKVAYLPQVLYHYYQRPGSIMHRERFSEKMLDIFTALESVSHYYERMGAYGRFERELEYLYIEHLFRSAALRFAPFPNAKPLFKKLKSAVESRFPRWRENPYWKRSGLPFRLVVHCAAGGHFRLIRILDRLKG